MSEARWKSEDENGDFAGDTTEIDPASYVDAEDTSTEEENAEKQCVEEVDAEDKSTEEENVEKQRVEIVDTDDKSTEKENTEKQCVEDVDAENKSTESVDPKNRATEDIEIEKECVEDVDAEDKSTEVIDPEEDTDSIDTEDKCTDEEDVQDKGTEEENTTEDEVTEEEDTEDEDTEEEEEPEIDSSWELTPDLLLEEIFSYLTVRERYYASLVCRNWYRAFKLQNVWTTFTLEDTTLTRGKFNYYSGWQYVLDHMRTSACLNKVGRNFKSLVFEPMLNFYNLYEFMNMVSWYTERQGSDNTSVAGVGTYVKRLKFTFPCNMANRDDPDRIRLFGTGGKLLEALKRLMKNLGNLRCLELIDLMLDSKDALHLMDDICAQSTQTLNKLVLINTTRFLCPLLHIGVFLNLNVLVVSPQNIDEDVIELIGYTKLEHLHIVQNRYSPKDTTTRLPRRSSWVKMRKSNPNLKVHFEVESFKPTDILLPIDLLEHGGIPCHSIVLDNPNTQTSPSTILTHASFFERTIRVYAFKGLTRYFLHRNFADRLDEALVQFCRMCPNLHTLMIRDKLSTATILQIVSVSKTLRCFYVRRNAILKRCDRAWARIKPVDPQHYEWLKTNSSSYEATEREVSRILNYRWHMLSEKEFQSQTLRLHL